MMDKLGEEIARRRDANAQDVANSLWSLVIDDHRSSTRTAAIETLWERACAAPVTQWTNEGLRQLSQVHLTLREGSKLATLPSAELQQKIDGAPRSDGYSETQRSAFLIRHAKVRD